jgi:hypothetical protein
VYSKGHGRASGFTRMSKSRSLPFEAAVPGYFSGRSSSRGNTAETAEERLSSARARSQEAQHGDGRVGG